ncbi:MFS transporter [Rossellomorea sp. BNER]|uniref:MFS transporter n=1 Tax=Rossellomorea sp. BNER TaxID=2962031 RepID=UPI003AF2B9A1|nr:MFS transporter [Rossellomorea sp. BNER]
MQEARAQTSEMEKESGLFKDRSFVMLWLATIFSSLSMSMFMFVQSWYIVEELGLSAALGIVLISLSIPRIIFMLIGGVLSDIRDQSKMMYFSDILRGILALGMTVLFLFSHPLPIWVLAVNAMLFGILGGLFEPARDSILPMIVKNEQLTRANSVMQGTMQIALFSGPLLAGIILSLSGYESLFIIISLLLIIGGFCVRHVKVNKPTSTSSSKGFGTKLKEGFMYIWKSRLLKSLFIIAIVVNFFLTGPMFMGLPIFVESILQGKASDFSYVQGGLTFGMIAGSIIMGVLNLRRRRGAYALYLMAAQGLVMLAFSQTTTVWMAIAVIIFIGILNPAVNIPLIAMIQEHTDKEKIGRVMGLIRMASLGLMPLSYAATSGVLGLGVSISTIMFWSAFPLIISVVLLFICFPLLRTVD